MDCNVRPDVCEHLIGHKPKDSYEKQAELFPKSLRTEYAKASRRLNIFSNFSSMARGVDNIGEVKDKLNEMERKLDKVVKRVSRTKNLRRKN